MVLDYADMFKRQYERESIVHSLTEAQRILRAGQTVGNGGFTYFVNSILDLAETIAQCGPEYDDCLDVEVADFSSPLSMVCLGRSKSLLPKLLQNCKNLKWVSIDGRTQANRSQNLMSDECVAKMLTPLAKARQLSTTSLRDRHRDRHRHERSAIGYGTRVTESENTIIARLQSLSVARTGIRDATLLNILSIHGETLRELSLRGCRHLTDNSLRHLQDMCPHLEALDISTLTISNRQLEKMFTARKKIPPPIHTLNASSITGVTDLAMISLVGAIGNTLETISVAYCISLSPEFFRSLVYNALKLHSVDFSFCKRINDDVIYELTGRCSSQLIALHIDGLLSRVSDQALCTLFKNTNSLQSLSIMASLKLSNKSLQHMLRNCHSSLTSLRLWGCTSLTDDGFTDIDSCRKLTSISLPETATSVTIRKLLLACNELQYLKCCNLSNSCALAVALDDQKCTFNNMRSLELLHCPFQDSGAVAVLSNCEQLESLVLAECHAITGQTIIHLSALKQLKHVSINNCAKISTHDIARLRNQRRDMHIDATEIRF
jgi:hypothetical protein